MVELREIERNELFVALIFHKMGFLSTFLKYRDKINPVFNTYFDLKKYMNSSNLVMYWILFDNQRVGQIWVKKSESYAMIARIFILKRFQNRKFAQQAILQAEQIFSKYKIWKLDTIEQEKNNCHLYEKLGYKPTGHRQRINNKMTIVYYQKILK